MIKKIIAAIFAFSMLSSVSAAESGRQFTFTFSGKTDLSAVAASYDKNNMLIGAEACSVTAADGKGSITLNNLSENFQSIRLYIPSEKSIITDLTEYKPADDGNNDTPGTPDTPEEPDNTKKYPAAYPSELDAATAFMVVKDASVVAVGDELKTSLTVLFRGSEYEFTLDEDKVIETASDAYPELAGAPLSALTEGDVIYCSSSLGGNIRSVELICRAPEEDVVTSDTSFGANFEKLYSRGGAVTSRYPMPISVYGAANREERQYAFGLIKDKKDKYITLCNKAGVADNDIKISISSDTIVYVYDMSARKTKLSLGDISYIEKSEFDNSLISNGNITSWNTDCIHNYALVRYAKGRAMEMVVYLNYND